MTRSERREVERICQRRMFPATPTDIWRGLTCGMIWVAMAIVIIAVACQRKTPNIGTPINVASMLSAIEYKMETVALAALGIAMLINGIHNLFRRLGAILFAPVIPVNIIQIVIVAATSEYLAASNILMHMVDKMFQAGLPTMPTLGGAGSLNALTGAETLLQYGGLSIVIFQMIHELLSVLSFAEPVIAILFACGAAIAGWRVCSLLLAFIRQERTWATVASGEQSVDNPERLVYFRGKTFNQVLPPIVGLFVLLLSAL